MPRLRRWIGDRMLNFTVGSDRQFDRDLVVVSNRQQLQCFIGRNIDFLRLRDCVRQGRGRPHRIVCQIAQRFEEESEEAVTEAKSPGSSLTASHRTEDEWNAERTHKTGGAQSCVCYMVDAIETLRFEGPAHKPCDLPLPYKIMEMQRSAHLPTDGFGNIKVNEARFDRRRQFADRLLDRGTRLRSRHDRYIVTRLGEAEGPIPTHRIFGTDTGLACESR